jgi:STE24 endopeptidase
MKGTPMVASVAGAVDVILLVGVAVVSLRLREWALAVGRSPDSTVEKAHRLRQAQVGWSFGFVGAGFLLVIISNLGRGPTGRGGHPTTTQDGWSLLLVGALVCYIGGLVAVRRAIRPTMIKVRDIEKKIPNRGRQLVVGLIFAAAVLIPYSILLAVAPRHGADHLVIIAAGYGMVIFLANALLAPLWLVALKAEVLPVETHRRLMDLSTRLHGGVRDIHSYPGRSQRTANAAQIGILPGLRYILVSDYLLENMTDDEVDAVVAHEIGHARGNHVGLKLLGIVAVWTGLAAISGSAVGTASSNAGVVGAVTPLAFVVALVLVQGILGIQLEQRADDAAARAVGPQHLATALAKLSDLNHTRLHTGGFWSILTQHPGLERRIARLNARPVQRPYEGRTVDVGVYQPDTRPILAPPHEVGPAGGAPGGQRHSSPW